jgi:hypothetical protein
MTAPKKQTLILDEEYMAELLSEELCGDCSPLGRPSRRDRLARG